MVLHPPQARDVHAGTLTNHAAPSGPCPNPMRCGRSSRWIRTCGPPRCAQVAPVKPVAVQLHVLGAEQTPPFMQALEQTVSKGEGSGSLLTHAQDGAGAFVTAYAHMQTQRQPHAVHRSKTHLAWCRLVPSIQAHSRCRCLARCSCRHFGKRLSTLQERWGWREGSAMIKVWCTAGWVVSM